MFKLIFRDAKKRRMSQSEFKRSASLPNQVSSSNYSATSLLKSRSDSTQQDKRSDASREKFQEFIKEKQREAAEYNSKSAEKDCKYIKSTKKKSPSRLQQQSRSSDIKEKRNGNLKIVGTNLHEHKTVSWSDAYSSSGCDPYKGHESPDTDIQSEEEYEPHDKASEKDIGSEEENDMSTKDNRITSLPDLLSSDLDLTAKEHSFVNGQEINVKNNLSMPQECVGSIINPVDANIMLNGVNISQIGSNDFVSASNAQGHSVSMVTQDDEVFTDDHLSSQTKESLHYNNDTLSELNLRVLIAEDNKNMECLTGCATASTSAPNSVTPLNLNIRGDTDDVCSSSLNSVSSCKENDPKKCHSASCLKSRGKSETDSDNDDISKKYVGVRRRKDNSDPSLYRSRRSVGMKRDNGKESTGLSSSEGETPNSSEANKVSYNIEV